MDCIHANVSFYSGVHAYLCRQPHIVMSASAVRCLNGSTVPNTANVSGTRIFGSDAIYPARYYRVFNKSEVFSQIHICKCICLCLSSCSHLLAAQTSDGLRLAKDVKANHGKLWFSVDKHMKKSSPASSLFLFSKVSVDFFFLLSFSLFLTRTCAALTSLELSVQTRLFLNLR